MSDELDAVLQHAARHVDGAVAVGHLRREREDAWDAIVVGQDGQPLVFWGLGEDLMKFAGKDAITNADGGVLMVVAATPPGVRPAGLISVPASRSGSPLAHLVTIVSTKGMTMIPKPAGEGEPPSGLSPDMLRSLVRQTAAISPKGTANRTVEAQDGGTIDIVLDWEYRPLLFWVLLPEREKPTLMAAALSGG